MSENRETRWPRSDAGTCEPEESRERNESPTYDEYAERMRAPVNLTDEAPHVEAGLCTRHWCDDAALPDEEYCRDCFDELAAILVVDQ